MLDEKEINRRIALDFNKNLDDVLLEIREIYPNVSEKDIKKWENSRALEFVEIDGKKRYFRRAARNLFRIDKEAKKLYIEKFGDEKAEKNEFLKNYLCFDYTQQPCFDYAQQPSTKHKDSFTFVFRLKVMANAVPDGEIIRCWLPFPRQDTDYQQNVKLISVNSDKFQLSENSVHQTIYIEKIAKKDEETVFEVKFEFDVHFHCGLDPQSFNTHCHCGESRNRLISNRLRVKPAMTKEEKPHIVFSEKIKKLSAQIIGNEQDNYQKAKKIFTWISQNIPWAVAREYSTIKNIPEYVLENWHGDCGQVSLLFITLCRLNGIPARWLSGFMLHPKFENLHDWAEIFIDGKGWLPVDVSFVVMNWAKNDDLRYFYFGNMDVFRLIINNGISGELCPAKIFPRSETVDFQRGEVEWQGGNIYFDKFNYDFWVEKQVTFFKKNIFTNY